MSAARKAEVAGEVCDRHTIDLESLSHTPISTQFARFGSVQGLSGNLLSNGAGMGAGAPVVSSGEVGSPLGKGAIGDYRSGEL